MSQSRLEEKVEEILEAMHFHHGGDLEEGEIVQRYTAMLGLGDVAISRDHPELQVFLSLGGLSPRGKVQKMLEDLLPEDIDQYYHALDLDGVEAIRQKTGDFLEAIDLNGDGVISLDEAKAVFARMMNVTPQQIPDDFKDMAVFCQLEGLDQEPNPNPNPNPNWKASIKSLTLTLTLTLTLIGRPRSRA